jgi:starch phosphorylase
MPRPTHARVAYFCMEYGLHEELPIYAGGLGILAGDHVKSAGELERPLVAVGLLWSQGYTRQQIDPDGRPYDEFPVFPHPHLVDTGVVVKVPVGGRDVRCRIHEVTAYGNAPLYLLDPVEEEDRWITRRLYGGSAEDRVAQEIVLGVGGVRALAALGFDPEVYHFNEGHAVFAGVELICEKMAKGATFEDAWGAVRQKIVFTTHTPVPAGNESHAHATLARLGANRALGYEQMKALGGDPFNMTVAGLRLARAANAVSALHGATARVMWKDVDKAAPIGHVTNGVHPLTWQDAHVRAAFESGDDAGLLLAHDACKGELFAMLKARNKVKLDPRALTIGFARRAAAYKRSDLLFREPERLARLFADGRLSVVLSGKAHPQDAEGKKIVANLVAMAKRFPNNVVFVENYDISIGRLLTRGCDVWLNNPIRPLEASGTSGMKAAMNGVLNLSVLDGWWPEGCEHGVNGWQVGDGYEGADHDRNDLASLWKVLEGEVLPAHADRPRWGKMMRASIAMSRQFSALRMVDEYFARYYADPRAAKASA